MKILKIELTPRGFERIVLSANRTELQILSAMLAHIRRHTPPHDLNRQFLDRCRDIHKALDKALKNPTTEPQEITP